MKLRKKLIILFAAAALLCCMAGCAGQEPQPTFPGGETVPAEGGMVDLRDVALTPEAYEQLCAQYPACEILWTVPFSDGGRSSDVTQLRMESVSESDAALLKYLPKLQNVELIACESEDGINRIREMCPGVQLDYTVLLAGISYTPAMESLVLTDPDCDELMRKISLFPQLQTVTLEGKLPEMDTLVAMKEACPEVTFVWNFEMFGIPVKSTTEFVDLSGIALEDTAQVESWLPCFYNLRQVDMVNCGISNEQMEELNLRHKDTKFVWSVSLGGLRTVRTDITYFMPYLLDIEVNNKMCQNLKYCHDVIFLDLGHMYVSDVSFLEYMPKMQYLILADTLLTDVELIGQLQELKFLEVFLTDVEDISPLLNCSKLEDLNISLIGDLDCTPLYQMTWLDRLWIISSDLDYDEMQELNYALSNTMIVYSAKGCTLKGWRMSPNYYKMRDVVDLWYAIT